MVATAIGAGRLVVGLVEEVVVDGTVDVVEATVVVVTDAVGLPEAEHATPVRTRAATAAAEAAFLLSISAR
ncbi:MAG TPA: hypothetical protein VFH70_10945 [Acidimicrobiales bacterium]|nr:hypothetical protein [Acidimicrobiales bacterium]